MNPFFTALIFIPLLFAQIMGVSGHRHVYGVVSPVTFVSANHCDNAITTATTISCTASSVASGTTLIVTVEANCSGDGLACISSVVDSSGDSATLIANKEWNVSAAELFAYYIPNAKSGTHTITVTFSTGRNYTRLGVDGFTGANSSNPIDTFAVASGLSGNLDSGPLTISQAGETLFAVGTVAGTAPVLSSDFTTITQSVSSLRSGYRAASAINSYHALFTSPDGNVSWVALEVALKP